MSKTVTAVPELFSVTFHFSFDPSSKMHVVAELFRHTQYRKYLVDVQVCKYSVVPGCFANLVGQCFSTVSRALTSPTSGPDLRMDESSSDALIVSLSDLVWHASHRGRNSAKLSLERWVVMV